MHGKKCACRRFKPDLIHYADAWYISLKEKLRFAQQQDSVGMLMVRRDRHDIVMDILKNTTSAKNKTQIMKAVNMSFVQAQQYLGVLLKRELIETLGNRHYKITNKGLDFLKKCENCFLCDWHPQEKTKLFRK